MQAWPRGFLVIWLEIKVVVTLLTGHSLIIADKINEISKGSTPEVVSFFVAQQLQLIPLMSTMLVSLPTHWWAFWLMGFWDWINLLYPLDEQKATLQKWWTFADMAVILSSIVLKNMLWEVQETQCMHMVGFKMFKPDWV